MGFALREKGVDWLMMKTEQEQRSYIAIDLKSFYA